MHTSPAASCTTVPNSPAPCAGRAPSLKAGRASTYMHLQPYVCSSRTRDRPSCHKRGCGRLSAAACDQAGSLEPGATVLRTAAVLHCSETSNSSAAVPLRSVPLRSRGAADAAAGCAAASNAAGPPRGPSGRGGRAAAPQGGEDTWVVSQPAEPHVTPTCTFSSILSSRAWSSAAPAGVVALQLLHDRQLGNPE
jgi:hypothetical protein